MRSKFTAVALTATPICCTTLPEALGIVEPPVPAVVCRDADDQPFLDLAAAHGAMLLSKDKAVVALRKRLRNHGAEVGTVLVAASRADAIQ